ncbi:hypothetical protein [Enterococcus mundtii]|uniref:hypothetical protein n=1 Tax=Enterococcus mundtii TaxID=53346 RepID=UPI0032DF6AF0
MTVTRNSFKGYVYQHQIFTFFAVLMDVDRKISEIEAENIVNHQFDDLRIIMNNDEYHVQIKNYPNVQLHDINISNDVLTIKNNKNKFNPENKNIVVVNSNAIETDTEIFGFDCIKIDDIYVIPMTPDFVFDTFEDMYFDDHRLTSILSYTSKLVANAQFKITINDIPKIDIFSTDLENKTIMVRKKVPAFINGCKFVIGKPGVGKSHCVNELINHHDDVMLYRFWVDSQDFFKEERLHFNEFIKNMSYLVFQSPKRKTEQELVDEINMRSLKIVVDGLDHVENYMPRELSKFLNFFDKISEASMLVFSRPLKHLIHYPIENLDNWTTDECEIYLSLEFNIHDYSLKQDIYDLSDGYPIICFFLANHYKIYQKLNISKKISGIEDYYDNLLEPVGFKTALPVFLVNSSYLTEEELFMLLPDQMLAEMILEFTNNFPYLFKKTANRLSLIHDSLNTYIKAKYSTKETDLVSNARQFIATSIMNKEIRFLSRFKSSNLSVENKHKIIALYSNIDVLNELMQKYYDFDSIREFYIDARDELENLNELLTIYEYYDLILIILTVQRNNLLGNHELLHNMVKYIVRKHGTENEIFSSASLWAAYQLEVNQDYYPFRKLVTEQHFSLETVDDYIDNLQIEKDFFQISKEKFNISHLEKAIEEANSEIRKKEILIWLLKLSFIFEDNNSIYYDITNLYLKNNTREAETLLLKVCNQFNIRTFFVKSILNSVQFSIWQLGFEEESNPFLNNSLSSLIISQAPNGSFNTESYVTSYLRLANYQAREIDFNSINLFLMMYYNRKDYSVYSFSSILIQFEKLGYIEETRSINLLKKLMKQSEKGIRNILTNYLKEKDSNVLIRQESLLNFSDFSVELFNLSIEQINSLEREKILEYFYAKVGRSKTINYFEIKKIFETKYKDDILNIIFLCKFEIYDVPNEEADFLISRKIRIRTKKEENIVEKKTFINRDYLSLEDKEDEQLKKLSPIELATYQDGWHNNLPYTGFFDVYDKDLLRDDLLKIIHNSLIAKSIRLKMFGNYMHLPASVLELIRLSESEVNWDKLFNSFCKFMDISLINYDFN